MASDQTTLREFLAALAKHPAPDDMRLSEASLRMILADLRDHARRLHAELQHNG